MATKITSMKQVRFAARVDKKYIELKKYEHPDVDVKIILKLNKTARDVFYERGNENSGF